jgi:gliding motility-associated protein GldE
LESDPYQTLASFLLASQASGQFTVGMIIGIIILVLLLVISGLISGSEVAFFSLSPTQIDRFKENDTRLNRMVIQHLQVPDRLLATILITNNFVNVAIVVISKFITDALITFSNSKILNFLIQIVIVTFLILFFSEIFPKIYANRFSAAFARFTAPVISFFSKLFWPVSSFLIYSTSIVNKRLIKHSGNLSIDDLSNALELTERNLPEEKNILKGIVKFGNIDVCDIMRSRVDTVAVDIFTGYKELLKIIDDSGYSRIPIYEESFDQIKGILYVKDLLPYLDKGNDFKWQELIRPSYFVPESKKINDLLKEFQTNRIHMAIVVDEYGGSSGIVTLEDIIEEIVGEITDETDAITLPYEKLDNNNYIFEGKTQLNDLYKILNLDSDVFDEVKGEADTIAGLILELRGEIPEKDDILSYKRYTFTIVSVDNRRIKKIKVTLKPENRK